MTYSIVAFDTATGQSGIAVASCVPLDVLRRVPGDVPGKGSFVTQSYLFDGSQPRARAVLSDGGNADATVAALIDPSFDSDFQLRQYAVIDADGGAAGFTGTGALPFAAHRASRAARIADGDLLAIDSRAAHWDRSRAPRARPRRSHHSPSCRP